MRKYFTFHNVSINTAVELSFNRHYLHFTFHNVSINTLYSTVSAFFCEIFTFHNVSINTTAKKTVSLTGKTLHSTMFLLIRNKSTRDTEKVAALHSTMFLLIHLYGTMLMIHTCTFTFHNVSINTVNGTGKDMPIGTLHSTMFLLIQ